MGNEATNCDIVRKFYEFGLAGKLQELGDCLGDDFVAYEPPSLPYGGEYHGRQEFMRLLGVLYTTWKDFSFEVVEIAEGGNMVAARVHANGRNAVTGRGFSMPVMEVFRVEGGLIREMRLFYFDTAALLQTANP